MGLAWHWREDIGLKVLAWGGFVIELFLLIYIVPISMNVFVYNTQCRRVTGRITQHHRRNQLMQYWRTEKNMRFYNWGMQCATSAYFLRTVLHFACFFWSTTTKSLMQFFKTASVYVVSLTMVWLQQRSLYFKARYVEAAAMIEGRWFKKCESCKVTSM